ncbi:MAG: histidine--tRNA ligase [Candidatus Pacebacteria bacterium RIFOXYB1_FULL_39_46]|nr:MAG: histidine--tRNA ligase [Candidatus Pacebacteria bacterium RIFOXYA1_FULL_38_18]OGJ38479.1 MAG: histidine--tRNA ligase [Candidatus Pacebacteria bacterium RIFOXYB1_FULL_39_46]OGJ40339.1 MAG: histidine--tRNA ligase [Candidatus Pacebacteria bacterium RIFOXYC1_FULL_39_21]OGJ40458.1 MAG: histidine--tRNA ligase [Candidatus Pacebacteria bacterium RIFOXYD1_FULL_39_27]
MSNKKQELQTLKGFRDLMPAEKRARDFVSEKLRETFINFGFSPLETPTLEYASLLLNKYGQEADKLIYTFEDRGGRRVGLRYDQTVPTARVLAQYQSKLPQYFRRYQIQNVFRADKPQQGRFREFTQCDIDIFGSTSPLVDAEIIACSYQAFRNVGFTQIELKINDRQTLLTTLQPFATKRVDVFSIIQSIDKLDKQSPEQVTKELVAKGLSKTQADQILVSIKKAEKSINLKEIEQNLFALGVPKKSVIFAPALARGLDYYTGMIFEIVIPEYGAGSCGGGGRYDNLIADLGGPNIPATGVAFGFDRMIEAATQLGLIPTTGGPQVLASMLSKKTSIETLKAVNQLREQGISVEIYPVFDKLGKQLKYANQNNIPWVLIVGEDEVKNNQISLKNMASGEQQTISPEKSGQVLA